MGRRRTKPPAVKLAETDLAEYVIKYLKEEGWEIYQEIQIRSLGNIADIIAVKDAEVMVVETKTTFGLGVLSQAHAWKRFAHYSAIAVPKAQNQTKARYFGQQVAWKFGMGIYVVSPHNNQVFVQLTPEKNSGADAKQILDVLTDQHKDYAKAGSKDGGHLTPWKITCQRLTELVKENPGISLKEAVKRIDHHYSSDKSAVNSLGKQIIRFDRVPNVYGQYEGRKSGHRLYYRAKQYSPFPPRRKSIEASANSKI